MVRIKKSSFRAPIPHFVSASGSVWNYPISDKFLPYNFYNPQKIFKYSRRVPTFFSRKHMFFYRNMLAHVRLVSSVRAYINEKSLETLRRFLRRMFGKHVMLKSIVFPKISRTQKPVGVRMGKGKGKKVIKLLACLSKGQTLFEIINVSFPLVLSAVRKLSYKLPFSVKVIRLALCYA